MIYKQMIYEIHCVSLPIVLIKIKVDQILPSSYISSLLVYTYFIATNYGNVAGSQVLATLVTTFPLHIQINQSI